jgi:hypothetical protein
LRSRCIAVSVTMVLISVGAEAQAPVSEETCRGQRISDIRIETRPPYEGSGRWWEFPLRIARDIHSTTRPSVIRRFLLLEVGDSCEERLRAESERILRAQPYLSEASVEAIPDENGDVVVAVTTTDEFTTVLSVSTGSNSPYLSALKLGDGNLGGTGTYASAQWRDGLYRDTWGARFLDHQFLGRRYMLELSGVRRDFGESSWNIDLAHPFVSEFQRVAWRSQVQTEKELFGFRRGDAEPAQVKIERRFVDIGGVFRVGVTGRLSVFGVSFSRESDRPSAPPVLDSTVAYDSLLSSFLYRNNARVNAIWGVRNIFFRRVERFDALTAAQDLRLGFQLGALFGRSLSVLGTTDDDILVSAHAYTGMGSDRTFVSFQARGEGRQNYDTNEWDGIISAARLSFYQRISDRNTGVFSADWGGGWKVRVPFQLTLGDKEGGVRGYRDSRDGGARRFVVRAEDRVFVGHVRRNADLGVALFADAGRLWGGDVPFGVNTPFKYSVGAGLLTAIPAGSKRTWRVDVAYPLSRDDHAKLEVRVTSVNVTSGLGWREPRDLTWSREQSVPVSVYNWP